MFLIGSNVMVVRAKIFNVRFFGDFELLVNIWRLLFLFIVIIISSRVIVFSFSYMRRLFVRNFIFLYLSFVIRII